MSSSQRTVLMILYYFPPAASGGTYRPLKFIRYLPEFGWRSVVIAPTKCKYESQDSTLLKEIPYGTEVIRVEPGVETTWHYALMRKFRMGNFYEHEYIPDRHAGFAENAIIAGKKRIECGGIDLIFSSATPNSVHIAGQELSKISNLPWVADFRDPWIADPFYNPASLDLDSQYREIEKSVFDEAASVISFPEYRAEIERNRYPEHSNKILAIDNGFDPADFPDPKPSPPDNTFVISHIGAITRDRTVTIFLEALKKSIETSDDLKNKIRLEFYGDARPPTPQDIDRLGFTNITEFNGYVSHREACIAMTSAHLLFMVLPDRKGAEGIMPIRLFEYVYSGQPVFLIAPDGEASRFVEKTGSGVWVNHGNFEEITTRLSNLINRITSGEYAQKPDLSLLKDHERKALTGKLASLFDRLLEGGSVRE